MWPYLYEIRVRELVPHGSTRLALKKFKPKLPSSFPVFQIIAMHTNAADTICNSGMRVVRVWDILVIKH